MPTTKKQPAANWRRKWKRAPADRRTPAARALGDLFAARAERRGLVVLMLLAAAAGHAGLLPFADTGRGKDLVARTATDSYLRRVVQKERARHVSQGHDSGRPPGLPNPAGAR